MARAIVFHMSSCARIPLLPRCADTGRDKRYYKLEKNVRLLDVQPSGSYAIKLTFDDGHDTGLYTWEYLHGLGKYQDALWHDYLRKLEEAGESRDPH